MHVTNTTSFQHTDPPEVSDDDEVFGTAGYDLLLSQTASMSRRERTSQGGEWIAEPSHRNLTWIQLRCLGSLAYIQYPINDKWNNVVLKLLKIKS